MYMDTPAENEEYSVQYQHYSGGRKQSFDLLMDYLQGTVVTFSLLVEQKHNGNWKVLSATIDEDETTADPEEALEDLAELRWHIFPDKERGRKIPPVVAVWETDRLVIAACLSDKYSRERFAAKKQEEPSAERRLCWWPDSAAWDMGKQVVSHMKQMALGGMEIQFYPFSKWAARPDVVQEVEELFSVISGDDDDPEPLQSPHAEMYADLYAQYLRRMRTMLLYLTQRKIAAKIVLEQTKNEMPDFVMEEISQTGPVGIVDGKIIAVVSSHSHWPKGNTGIDMIGATIYTGTTHLTSLLFWPNPLVDDSEEKATDALLQELTKRCVQKVIMADQILPFEICPHCHQVLLPGLPDEKEETCQ